MLSQLWVNSTSQVLQHCCCYVCLRYITRKLQRLRHSPHYINPRFILKCVPACLALQNVQGKGICFFPVPPPKLSLPFSELTNREMAKAGRWWWRGAWQTGSEQWVEKDADVKAMNLWTPVCIPPFLPFPHTTPPSSPSISPSSLPSLFFNAPLKRWRSRLWPISTPAPSFYLALVITCSLH